MEPLTLPPTTPATVVFALIGREFKTRLGTRLRDYVLAIVEPVLHMLVLLSIFGSVGRVLLPGTDMAVFFGLGVIHFLFFRGMLDRVGAAIASNRPLMFYRQVQPIYAVVARITVDLYIHVSTLSVLVLVAVLTDHNVELQSLGKFLLATALLVGLSVGTGLLLAALTHFYPVSKVISANLFRVLYFVSCVFYPLALTPAVAREVLVWNPVVHALELIRESWLAGYPSAPETNVGYAAAWSLGMLLVGLTAYYVSRHKLGSAA